MESSLKQWMTLVEADRQTPAILVVVHPASACGSADFNLGEAEAAACRGKLVAELAAWRGGVIILDGDYAEELAMPAYRPLQDALAAALARAKSASQVAIRRVARDPAQMRVMRQLSQKFDPARDRFRLTGAWFHPGDAGGCVGSVLEVLQSAGFAAAVQPSALTL